MLLWIALACGHPVDLAAPTALAAPVVAWTAPAPLDARALLHEARDAEQAGDLQRAFDLARDAYVARPTRATLRYVEVLEGRLRSKDGVAVSQPGARLPRPQVGG